MRRIAVLDRTKEPGSIGEPLFLDVVAALTESHEDGVRVLPRVSGGRYGLSSKEFTPGMVAGVFEELASERPRRHFTVGITDDVSGTSLTYDASLDIDPPNTVRAVFFGLGADGTVGANKNTIKILGSEEHLHAQGYFVYDSKKSGAQTVSHLRFGPQPIRAPYLVQHASFVGCHQFGLLEQVDVLARSAPGATLLLNCRHPPDTVWEALSRPVQEQILAAGARARAGVHPHGHCGDDGRPRRRPAGQRAACSTPRTAPDVGCASRPARPWPRATRSARRSISPSASRCSPPRVSASRSSRRWASDRSRVDFGTVRGTQFLEPLFEFSSACAGCGKTP